jgi:hypothetical protein
MREFRHYLENATSLIMAIAFLFQLTPRRWRIARIQWILRAFTEQRFVRLSQATI